MVRPKYWLAMLCVAFLTQNAVAAERGSVTNLPVPRYVSLKAAEGNVRRGPSLTHKIDWVFKHRNMPLELTAEYGNWRRVRDMDGAGGWVHYSLLSGMRTVVVQQDLLELQSQPDEKAQAVAKLEAGVIARLGKCLPDWCRLNVEGRKGWARKDALWGVDRDELRE